MQLAGMQGREQGSCLDHGDFAGPRGSRATSVQRIPFPACRDPGQLGREGITHLHRGCGSRGRKGCSPSSPPTKDGFFPLWGQLGPR